MWSYQTSKNKIISVTLQQYFITNIIIIMFYILYYKPEV
jgi:hypothetical protein